MSEIYRSGPFELHPDRHELLREGTPIRIEPKPLEVLAELVRHAGELVTKGELMESVWANRVVTDSVITRCINKLRVALDDESQTLILTVHGYGYRFMGKVTCVQDETAAARIVIAEAPKAGDTPPMRPNWRLVRPLDERGAVWLAVHDKTAEKRVFKYGIEPHQVRSLRREISIHRLLQNGLGERGDIARLIDFNLQALPYFLELEYCAHGNLSDWCASPGGAHQVPMEIRIDLMTQAAEALSAAHLLGVLHMDIKPSNLLIWTAEGGRPRIRWSDFGSGRLLQPWRLAELGITQLGSTHTVNSEAGPLQGTLNYLAPELLRGETPTVRSDLYALGVMLFQIVAGDLRKPMAVGWEENVVDELLRSDIAACAHDNPALRLSSADELATRLRELDERRIARQREHEDALQAAAMRKRLDRARVRRPWLIAATGALVMGLGISLWFYRSAVQARDEALHKQKVAEATRAFVDEILNAAAPYTVGNHGERSVREAIDYASEQIDRDFKNQPELEAAVRITLATVKSQFGDRKAAAENAARAAELSRRTLGPDDPQTLHAEFLLGAELLHDSRFTEADAAIRRIESRIAAARVSDPDTLIRTAVLRATYYNYLEQYERSAAYSEAAIAEQMRFDPGHLSMLTRYRARLAVKYAHQGRFDAAEKLFQQIQLGLSPAEQPGATLSAKVEALYGIHLYLQQRYTEADKALAEAQAVLVRNVDAEDESAGETLRYRGLNLLKLGRAAEAFETCRLAYESLRRRYGDDSHFTLLALGDLGITELQNHRAEQGVVHLSEAADKLQIRLGWVAPDVQYFRYHLLAELIRTGSPLEGRERLLEQLDPAVLRFESPRENWASHLPLLKARLLLADGHKAAAAQVLAGAFGDSQSKPTDPTDTAEAQRLLLAARE